MICVLAFVPVTISICGITIQAARAQEIVAALDAHPELVSDSSDDKNDQIEIRIWWGISGNPLGEEFNRQIQRFNSSQNRIFARVETKTGYDGVYQALKTSAAIDGPDVAIVEVHSVASLAASQKVQFLDTLIDQDKEFRPNDLLPGILTNLRYEDKIAALPFNRSTPVLYYNKDRFAKVGLDPEKPPETWQELQEYARLLTSSDGSQFGFLAANFPWVFESMVWSSGGQLTEGERATFAKPGSKAMRIWTDMVHRDKTAYFSEHFSERAEFISGRAAMVIESSALLKWCSSAADFKVGVAVLPRYEGFSNVVPTGGGAAVIPTGISAEQTAAAWTFLTWLISTQQTADWSRATGYVPVRKSAQALLRTRGFYEDHPAFLTANEEMKFARESPQAAQWTDAWPIIGEAMVAILRDDAPVLETLDGAERRVESLLKLKSN
jgi:sn-glycerol 3-phosphate transport system substrate-binding protein